MKLGQKFKNPQTARECFQTLDVVESAIGTADGSSLLPAPIEVVEVPIPTASVSPETADEYGSSTSRSSLSEAVRSQSCDSNISSVDVLWAGDFYTYNIPSFSVLTVELRHVEITLTNDIGYSKVDGFMREDSDILNKVPHSLEIIKACKIDVSQS